MTKLEHLLPNTSVRGILPDGLVTVVTVQWYGSEALEIMYKDASGRVANQLLFRHDEPRLEVVEEGRPWSFDGDGALFRLVSEAHRIRLAHLFDPVLAVHTSLVEPLPHQITAVYEAMLPRHPLRFLLADDPGSGKTIMAGLLIKELIVRGDLQRCLVVCPGSLAEQWQDELQKEQEPPPSPLAPAGPPPGEWTSVQQDRLINVANAALAMCEENSSEALRQGAERLRGSVQQAIDHHLDSPNTDCPCIGHRIIELVHQLFVERFITQEVRRKYLDDLASMAKEWVPHRGVASSSRCPLRQQPGNDQPGGTGPGREGHGNAPSRLLLQDEGSLVVPDEGALMEVL